MQHMSALASLPLSIKKQLCLKMVFAVVAEAGTVVMHHNERLDAWSVIVNGQVEVIYPTGERYEYKLGDSFGAKPIFTPQVTLTYRMVILINILMHSEYSFYKIVVQ